MDQPSTAAKTSRLLIGESTGEGTSVAWDMVPSHLPPLLGFDEVVIIPKPDTEEQQVGLVEVIQGALRFSKRSNSPPRIVWILNKHATPAVGELSGIGRLIPMGNLENAGARAVGVTPYEPNVVQFGIDLKSGAVALAAIEYISTGIVVPVAASRNNWILAPPPHTHALGTLASLPKLRRLSYVLLVLIATISLVLWNLAEVAEKEYRIGIGQIAVFSPIREIQRQFRASVGAEWRGPQANLANRLLTEQFSDLVLLARSTRPGNSVHRPWDDSGWHSLQDYFTYSILAGDASSAVAILNSATTTANWERSYWLRSLTETFWQLSVESLHELDFNRADNMLEIYLHESYRVASTASSAWGIGPQRNRALAQILRREIRSQRIYSLCQEPGVQDSFGRLLGDEVGYRITDVGSPGLTQRRTLNSDEQCGSVPAGIYDYDRLSELEAMLFSEATVDPYSLEVCGIAGQECRYINAHRSLLDGSALDSAATLHTVWRNAVSPCNYLSDDLLWETLDAMGRMGDKTSAWLSVRDLNEAVQCVQTSDGADFKAMFMKELTDLSCDWINLDSLSLPEEIRADPRVLILVRRCQP